MPTYKGQPVFRPTRYHGGRSDDPHGVTAPETHGEEGLTRTKPHPMQGSGPADTVGTYVGSIGPVGARTHLFSAEGTEGGESDSHTITDTEDFQWSPALHNKSGRYAYNRKLGHSGTIQPYTPEGHWGLPGAPMSDTKPKYHDRNYQ